jgi:alpha-ketoglutarate-dependent taurine dioxygenase
LAVYTGWNDSRNSGEEAVKLSDGKKLDKEMIQYLETLKKENMVAYKWQNCDIVMIDNYTVMHARNTFTPPRRILACLCK